MSKQRSMLLFEQAIKSPVTRKVYKYNLKRFLEWSKIKNYDGLLQAPQKQIQELVEDYVFHLKNTVSANSVPTYYACIELFFTMNDVILNFKKIRKLFPEKVKMGNGRGYTLQEIQKILTNCNVVRSRALVLLLASSGIRQGAIPEIKLKHMSRMENSYCILIYEDSTEESFIFTTPEATESIDEYLEKRKKDGEYIDNESPLFRSTYRLGIQKVIPCTSDSLIKVMMRLISVIDRKKVGKTDRYDVAMNHGFRKFYATVIKDVEGISPTMTEKLINHVGINPLDGNYYKPTKEKMFEAYKKCISVLTIDDSIRNKIKIEKLENDKTDLKEINSLYEKTIKEKKSIIKEKELIERKYRDIALNTKITDEAINKRIDELLERKKNTSIKI
jgi:integrase